MKKISLCLFSLLLLTSCSEEITFNSKDATASYVESRWNIALNEEECVFYVSNARNTFHGDGATYMVFECKEGFGGSQTKDVKFEQFYQQQLEALENSKDYLGNKNSLDVKFDFSQFEYTWMAKKKDSKKTISDISDFEHFNENPNALLLLLHSKEIEKLFVYEFNI